MRDLHVLQRVVTHQQASLKAESPAACSMFGDDRPSTAFACAPPSSVRHRTQYKRCSLLIAQAHSIRSLPLADQQGTTSSTQNIETGASIFHIAGKLESFRGDRL
jgi:hypothetical protein